MAEYFTEVESLGTPPPVPLARDSMLKCEDTLGQTVLGFEIRCQCGSTDVEADAYSGEVTLSCRSCKRSDVIHREVGY